MKIIHLHPGSVHSQDVGGLDGQRIVQRRLSSKSEAAAALRQIFNKWI